MRDELRLAADVPRWALRFYLRYLPVVGGLSLIPSVQRLVVVQWGEHLPGAVAVASEVLVVAVRLLLLAVVWRLATRHHRLDWGRWRPFLADHWRSLVLQGVMLAVLAGVFNFGLEDVVGGLLPESARQTYLAVLLFVKNPTIIAVTFIWMVGFVRQPIIVPSTSDSSLVQVGEYRADPSVGVVGRG